MIIIGALFVSISPTTVGSVMIPVTPTPTPTPTPVPPTPTETEVWVNLAWAGSIYGQVVDAYGHVFGINATDTISNGSKMIVPYGKINLAPGNYGSIVITQPLILNGSKSGVPGSDPSRGSGEAVIGGVSPVSLYSYGIKILASDVIVDGLTVTGYDIGIGTNPAGGPYNNVTIINNRIINSSVTGIDASATDSNISCNLVKTTIGNTITGISAIGDGFTISGNTIGGDTNPAIKAAIKFIGDDATVTGNDVRVGSVSADYLVYGEGDDNLLANNKVEYMAANNTVGIFGNNNNVSYNQLGQVWYEESLGTQSITPQSGVIYYNGDFAIISNNNIGGGLWNYGFGIAVDGDHATIADNDLMALSIGHYGINVEGDSAAINGNDMDIVGSSTIGDAAIRCVGDDATINGNSANICNNGIVYEGYSGTISGNTIGDPSNPKIYRAINYTGDSMTVTGNNIRVGIVSADYLVLGIGNDGLFANNKVEYFAANNTVGIFGNKNNVSDNVIGDVWYSSGMGAQSITPQSGVLYYEGDDAIIKDNQIGGGTWSYSFGIAVDGDRANIAGNHLLAIGISHYGINVAGVSATISGNDMKVGPGSIDDTAIRCIGDEATINGNSINKCNDGIVYVGYSGTIDGNSIGNPLNSNIHQAINFTSDKATVTGNNVRVGSVGANYLVLGIGDDTLFANNKVEYFSANNTVGIFGNNNNVSYNQLGQVWYTLGLGAQDITPQSGVLYYEGNDAVIKGNMIGGDQWGYGFGIAVDGDRATIDNNHLTAVSISNDAIHYEGVNGNITRNVITASSIGDNAIQYGDVSMYLSADSQQFPNYAGTIADNTLNAGVVHGAFIDYFGDAGTITRNTDASPYEFAWPMVMYRAALFGHGTITDNTGGMILYFGDELPLAPYGTITGNHINSTLVGVAAIGDYNVIADNEINATVGTYTVGTKVIVKDNDFTALPYMLDLGSIDLPLAGGVIFDGDMCQVSDNTFLNETVGVANVGLFKVISIDSEGAVSTEYTDKVNASLEDVGSDIAALSGLAEGVVSKYYASSGEGASVKDVAALDSLGYRGYGNKITDNEFIYDYGLGGVGIVNLGYDFVIDSNTFDCVNESLLLAGIICGGDGGQVTNNEMSNITLLGVYYGGLLKFEDGIYTSDLLGMDAVIRDNTIDNSNSEGLLGSLFPWGIIFTGYDAAIDQNDLLGLGLGVLSVQFEGSIVDNTIDTFSDPEADLFAFDATSVRPMEGEVVNGLGGIISVCNNLTVTGNIVNGTIMGMLFVPIDPYTTWGNAYVNDNVLTNNVIQMFFVPSYFMFHMEDGSVKPISTETMLEVMDDNTLDRAVYLTDEAGDFAVVPLYRSEYFNISATGVSSDIDLGVIFAYLCNWPVIDGADPGAYTVNVMPGTYTLDNPVVVPMLSILTPKKLTILGDPENPENVIVDTGKIPVWYDNTTAFEVCAPNVTISGFTVENSNNTFADKIYYQQNYGVAVGPMYGTYIMSPDGYLVYYCNVTDNVFKNLTCGVYLDSSAYSAIEGNLFTDNNMGVYLTNRSFANSTEIHYNDFVDNLAYGVNNNGGEDRYTLYVPPSNWVNATYNWWNSYQGPKPDYEASTSTGDNVTYFVLYEPWLTKPMFSTLYTYHLVPGWNLISVPLDAPDTSITGFFPASVQSGLVDIWGWNETKQDWVYYSPNPSDPFYGLGYEHLTSLKTGRGYWVEMTTEAYFQIEGSAPANVPLVSEWNLVGPTGECSSMPQVLYSGCVDVWGWNETKQDWVYYSPNPSDPFYGLGYEHLTSVQPGHGYWVEMP
jgi:parallel beta-helix repeat protein